MENNIKCSNGCNILYNNFSISEKAYLDELFDNFKNSSETYCAFILTNISLDLGDNFPYTKVIYVTNGSLNVHVNDLSAILSKDHFLFVNAHSRLKISPNTEDTVFFNFYFKRTFFHPSFMKKLSEYEIFYNFINFCLMGRENNKAHTLFKCNNFTVRQLLYIMLSLVKNKNTDLLEAALLFLFEYLYKSEDSEVLTSLSTFINASIVNSMIKYISINYNDVTLHSLSKHFNYHPNYISNLIKKETNMTFQQHVQNAKLKKAAYLLINTDLYIKDIALDLGYVDTSYFNKIFKETYNCTPTDYRVKNKSI
ncbi:helix-turn-helix transcriptional regulator [Tissierella praeacuta]|uniref:AraC-type DNA-binding protein n=1 Tax=Tissierella praeacuta DSM 18095 TaxID=1123404 RepID=A0A1M4V6Y0_9FIRM|nr:helix-turn-helix transcriptional regulator [Tissierella praeacuta]MBU5255042.1 helix-turn-helix transcriptional regulator [Tissierella praeacuta]TCU74109.1 AraC-like DNA-binding protein [Tissierella praeacuta]SHE64725.1 AraC-type DNA-binding protein [Tissierella praeacuta DSM 18095]SUP02966.1 Uncharacterized HTH-type transcriptional regulator ypdC [Tissierella praeacuta]